MEELKEMANNEYRNILNMLMIIVDKSKDKEEIKEAIEKLLKQV